MARVTMMLDSLHRFRQICKFLEIKSKFNSVKQLDRKLIMTLKYNGNWMLGVCQKKPDVLKHAQLYYVDRIMADYPNQ